MKYLRFGSILLLAILALGQGGAEQPPRLKTPVRSMVFDRDSVTWLLSESELARTLDGGRNWTQIPTTTMRKSESLSFVSSTEGWSVDSKGDVWRTHDGGSTWQFLSNVLPAETPHGMAVIKKFLFIDPMNGWLLTPFALYSTEDGGERWKDWTLADANHFHFITDRLGWIDDKKGKLYKTVDGGKTWQLSGDPKYGELQDIFFTNENLGWVCPVRNSGILHTTDGGKNWIKQTLPTSDLALTSMQFLNEKEGWMTGFGEFDFPKQPDKSVLLHTVDGGQRWEVISTIPSGMSLKKIYFSTPEQGWLYTNTALYRTTDRGHTWTLNVPMFTSTGDATDT